MNTALILEMVAEADAERIGVGTRAGGLTYPEVLARARRLAAELGRTDATAVAFVGLNGDLLPVLLFGGAIAGVPFAPVNYRLPDPQLRSVLERLAPAVAVVDDEMVQRVAGIEGVTVVARSEMESRLDEGGRDDEISNESAVADPDAIAVLLFTSGTTGEPKAAVLRHRHLTSYIFTTVDFMAADAGDAQLVCVPPYHIAGISSILSSVFSGRRIVYLPAFDAEEWVRTARDEAITQAMVVPTMLERILDQLDDGLPALRHVSYGGGRMPRATIERAMGALGGVGWTNAYGLTETSSTIAVLTPEDHHTAFASEDPAKRARLGSVGRPVPTIELEIRDERGRPLPPGERGEIFVRGEQIAGEYLGKSLLTEDGWFPTNDAGYLDAEGYLFLDGRLDDVIVRGAENLSPGEIEDVLVSHPAVAEAAVVGVPDPTWGERVVAAVVLTEGAAATQTELQDYVRGRLRSTKTPEHIDFRTDLPHNETGKLLRRVLREELASPDREGES